METGDRLLYFTLKDQDGHLFDIKDYIGRKKLVIYFYPGDDTPVCTREACAFRDSLTAFSDAGAMVIGINSGTVESHKAFQQKYHLPFTLLSDPGNKVLTLFGVKNLLFLTGRETFLVDLNGIVVFKFRSMLKGTKHVTEMLDYLKEG